MTEPEEMTLTQVKAADRGLRVQWFVRRYCIANVDDVREANGSLSVYSSRATVGPSTILFRIIARRQEFRVDRFCDWCERRFIHIDR